MFWDTVGKGKTAKPLVNKIRVIFSFILTIFDAARHFIQLFICLVKSEKSRVEKAVDITRNYFMNCQSLVYNDCENSHWISIYLYCFDLSDLPRALGKLFHIKTILPKSLSGLTSIPAKNLNSINMLGNNGIF